MRYWRYPNIFFNTWILSEIWALELWLLWTPNMLNWREMTFLDSFCRNIPFFSTIFIVFMKSLSINLTSCKNKILKIRAWPLRPAPKMEEMHFFSMKKCRLLPFWPSEGNFDHLAALYVYFYGLNKISENFEKWAWPNNCPLIMQYQENGPFLRGQKARLQHFYT